MAEADLNPELLQFLRRNIRSVEHVEILTLLSAAPERQWTVKEVNVVIRSSEESVLQGLESLVERALVKQKGTGFQYEPESDELRLLAEELIRTYREKRVRVIEAIYCPSSTIEEFSDAFRLRKD